MTRLLLLLIATATLAPLQADPLKTAVRILFLGDSITDGGHYITLLQTSLRKDHPTAEFINLGLSSEGCSGLSEPAHPFPRPNVHSRLEAALAKTEPDVVFACYGMNDGIYYPFSDERFGNYQDGMNQLIAKVHKSGATLILMTSPPFDPVPLLGKGVLLPAEAKEFSWMKIYRHYDRDVLARYAKWLRTLSDRPEVSQVIDLHAAMSNSLAEHRKTNPKFSFCGDGIHPNRQGHELMARTIYRALYQRPLPSLDAAEVALVAKQQRILHAAWVSHVGHQRPGVRKGLPLKEAKAKAKALR